MSTTNETVPINETEIQNAIEAGKHADAKHVREILAKAGEMKGLNADEACVLMNVTDKDLVEEICHAAASIKDEIYGRRLVLFAPLYISNLCGNECSYCAFRAANKDVRRKALTQEEIAEEVRVLIDLGHKRLLLVAGESYPNEGFNYIIKSIATVYSVKNKNGEIRRLNVNIAPLTLEEFKELKGTGIGTYQLFQETYHRPTYSNVHLKGKKRDYDWRISALDRAMEAGIDDVGIGVLFGLYDWKYETLAMLQHIKHLEDKFGVGPHTISVPRLEPALGSDIAAHPPHGVSDADFRKLIAILRITVPYTGIILSTRENPEMRRESFSLGVSQISAGSRTNPGGYKDDSQEADGSQFSLGDHRPMDVVIRDIASMGYMPSFCTSCYRLGRTGGDFMDLAKPGEIKYHCGPNAMSTFMEYLIDYASPETREVGERLIEQRLEEMDNKQRMISQKLLDQVKAGDRDVYC